MLYWACSRGYGGIGRRAGFRFLCRKACGFDPHYPYQLRNSLFGTNPRLTARLLSRTGNFFASNRDPLRWVRGWGEDEAAKIVCLTHWCSSEISTTAPFPPSGETCALVGISSLSAPTRCAGLAAEENGDTGCGLHLFGQHMTAQKFPVWHESPPDGEASQPDREFLRIQPRSAPLAQGPVSGPRPEGPYRNRCISTKSETRTACLAFSRSF